MLSFGAYKDVVITIVPDDYLRWVLRDDCYATPGDKEAAAAELEARRQAPPPSPGKRCAATCLRKLNQWVRTALNRVKGKITDAEYREMSEALRQMSLFFGEMGYYIKDLQKRHEKLAERADTSKLLGRLVNEGPPADCRSN